MDDVENNCGWNPRDPDNFVGVTALFNLRPESYDTRIEFDLDGTVTIFDHGIKNRNPNLSIHRVDVKSVAGVHTYFNHFFRNYDWQGNGHDSGTTMEYFLSEFGQRPNHKGLNLALAYIKEEAGDGNVRSTILPSLILWTRDPRVTRKLAEGKIPDQYALDGGYVRSTVGIKDIRDSVSLPDLVAVIETEHGQIFPFSKEDEDYESLKTGNYNIQLDIRNGNITKMWPVEAQGEPANLLRVLDFVLS